MSRTLGPRWEGTSRRGRGVLIVCTLAAGVAACSVSSAPQSESAAPTPSAVTDGATPAPPAPLAKWQERGATEVPPADLQQVSLNGVQVVNETGGEVKDEDARAWAGALLRSYNFALWAVNHGQDRFLLTSGLSSAAAVFRTSINDIGLARKAGSRVEYSREVFRRLVLRKVPATLQPAFDAQRFVLKPYAFFLDAVGPITTTWIDGKGARTVKSQLPAGAAAYELMGGELAHDPLMGDVWVLASDWNCTVDSSRRGLAPLCNP